MFQANFPRRRGSTSSRRSRTQKNRFRPLRLCLEQLESRQMLSGTPVQLVSQAAIPSATAPGTVEGISQDGRYEVFGSNAANILSGYSFVAGVSNIYRYDRLTGHIDLVSINSAGTGGGNGISSGASISADGSVVAFESRANNLQTAIPDTNGTYDIYLRNLNTGITTLVSANASGTGSGNQDSGSPEISADGNVVAFTSDASNLQTAAADTNGGQDVYVRNLTTGITKLASVNTAGTGASGAQGFALSANGNVVALMTSGDIYARNLNTNTTSLVSVNAAGTGGGNNNSSSPQFSPDGNIIVFSSNASDLQNAIPDTNHAQDIFARNLTTGITTLLSVNAAGTASGNGESARPVISANGSVVVFQSAASDLQTAVPDSNGVTDIYARNLATTTTTLVTINASGTDSGNGLSTGPVICADGTVVAFESDATNLQVAVPDTNADPNNPNTYIPGTDVFVRNLSTGSTSLVSVNAAGTGSGNNDSLDAVISADGSVVAFDSDATDIQPNDLDGSRDAFVRPLSSTHTQTISLAAIPSSSAAGNSAVSQTHGQSVSADGRYLVFVSDATNLVAGYAFKPGVQNVYRYDRATGQIDLVSVNSSGTGGGSGDSNFPSISADGSVVAFDSDAADLQSSVPAIGGVFVRNMKTGVTILASVNSSGTGGGNNGSYECMISADGSTVVFDSDATDLQSAVPDSNHNTDVFARDLTTNTTVLLSVNAAGTASGNGGSVAPIVDADGKVVEFVSLATNLQNLPDNNGTWDLFVRNLTTNTTSLVSINAAGTSTGQGSTDFPGAMSADGSKILFTTPENLSPFDTNGQPDAYVRNITTGTNTFVGGNASSLSADGTIASFTTNGSNGLPNGLFVRNLSTGSTSTVTFGGNSYIVNPVMSADGQHFAFNSMANNLQNIPDTNGDYDVYAWDANTGLRLVSVNSAGTRSGNAGSGGVVMSADGSTLAFGSSASDLVASDFNSFADVFISSLRVIPTSKITLDGNGNLVVSDNAPGGKNDEWQVSYNSGTGKIVIQDLNGSPIITSVGTGNGTSTVQVAPGAFAGGVIFNGGAGNDALTMDPSFVNSGKHIQFDGGTGGNSMTVPLTVNPATINSDLANVVYLVRGSTTNVSPPRVIMAVDNSNLAATLAAVAALVPDDTGAFVEIDLDVASGSYSGQTIAAPAGAQLVLDGNGDGAIFSDGATSAFNIQYGNVSLFGIIADSTANVSTIVVTGGSVLVNDSTIHETTGGSQAAIEVTGGSIDLGNGGNTFDVRGPGQAIKNLTSQSFLAFGNVFQQDGASLTDGFAIEDRVYHGMDQDGLGIVYFVSQSLYATATNLGIQRAVDVAAPGDKVFVQSGMTQDFNAGAKLVSVYFADGTIMALQPDPLIRGQSILDAEGTPGNDTITFSRTGNAGAIVVQINGGPKGTFLPTGRLEAFGGGGDDNISVDGSISLSAWLYGGDGNDQLKGGKGNSVLIGGAGDDVLQGGQGRSILIGGDGADRLLGGSGDDILIAGTTAFDSFDDALMAILNEWTSDRSYADRVANLTGTNPASPFRFFSPFNGQRMFLNTDPSKGLVSIFGDNAANQLTGAAGADLFFADLVLGPADQATVNDKITDLSKSELAFDTNFPPDTQWQQNNND